MTKLIATGTYQNGAFGTNHISISRHGSGYVVRDHYADGCWWDSVADAKKAFRDLVARSGASVTFRRWKESY